MFISRQLVFHHKIVMNLKFLAISFAAAAFFATQAQAVEYITATPATDGYWSNLSYWKTLVSWSPYTVQDATELPLTNEHSVSLNTKSLVVDGNYTTRGVYTNSGLTTGIVEMRGDGEDYDPLKHSLLIDIATMGYNSTWSGKGTIEMRGSSATADQTLTFANGVISITDTKALGTSTAVIDLYSNSKDGTSIKTLNFEAPTTLTSTENLRVFGYSKAPERGIVNFNGTVTAKNGDTWKDFSSAYATVNINNTFDVGKATVEYGVLNVNEGATLTANNTIKVGTNGEMYIDGQVNAIPTISTVDNIQISANGYMKVGETGSIKLEKGYTLIRLYGTLEINSAEGSIICSRYLRMCNGGKLILNTSNALKDTDTQYATIWLSENGSSEIVVNADNHFRGICFRTDNGSNYSDVTLTLGEGCNTLIFDSISTTCDTNQGLLLGNNKLVIVNFENNKIKVLSTVRDENELQNIYADGYEDGSFYLEAADDGGYWLNAVAVPEPAAAAIFAAMLALGLAVYRKRK